MSMRLFCAAAVAGLAVAPGMAAVQVWAEAGTRRVVRSEAPPAGAAGSVAVTAARGETRGFQILLRADAPVTVQTVAPGAFRGPGGATLEGLATVSRVHQLHLELGSYRVENFTPDWYPDPLIPVVHPVTGAPLEGRYQALPFELPANETHGFWIDLAVPRDAAAGEWTGAVQLGLSGGETRTVPVALTVWDFALPESPSAVTALGNPLRNLKGWYETRAREGQGEVPADWAQVTEQVDAMLAAHRINAVPPDWRNAAQDDGSYRVSDEDVAAVREFIDRYGVNALSIPRPSTVVKDPVAEAEKLQRWFAGWDDALARLDRPEVVAYVYLKDEPNDAEAYQMVQTWGRAITALNSRVKMMVVEQTKTQDPAWGDLYGAVDIWCPLFPLHDPATAAERRALGEQVWCYTALCQREPTPWWLLDTPLLNYRVPLWQAWRESMTGILYWGSLSYWKGVEDMWTDPKTLDRRDRRPDNTGPLYNGEGTLLYPGEACGFDGFATSLRLKALRDGLQDYDYLTLLAARRSPDEADEIAVPLAATFFDWNPDPAAYDTARAELARRIVGGK